MKKSKAIRKYRSPATVKNPNFRVREVADKVYNLWVVEELRWGRWHIIEELYTWSYAVHAAKEYNCEVI